jgi:hypothetical protein
VVRSIALQKPFMEFGNVPKAISCWYELYAASTRFAYTKQAPTRPACPNLHNLNGANRH